MASTEADNGHSESAGEIQQADETVSLESANTHDPVTVDQLRAAVELDEDPKSDETIAAAKRDDQDKNSFPFLTLPPEVRNKIYHEYMALIRRTRMDYGRCLFQPVLTIVSKQVRAETLPIFYGRHEFLIAAHVQAPSSWIRIARETMSSFIPDLDNPPESNSLRHLRYLNLLLAADKRFIPCVQVRVEMTSEAPSLGTGFAGHDEYDPDEEPVVGLFPRLDQLRRKVMIGGPDLDWTDQQAVQLACDQTVARLGEILTKMQFLLDFRMSSDLDDYRYAMNVIRMVARACPHLTKTVFIRDSTEASRSCKYTATPHRIYRWER